MTTQMKRAKVEQIEGKLNELAELQAELATLKAKQQRQIDVLLGMAPTFRKAYDDVQIQIESCNDVIKDQTATVKDAVLVLKETVKGEGLQAVYSNGKTSWNTDQLLGYAKTHKAVLEMKKEGDPSISIRKVGK